MLLQGIVLSTGVPRKRYLQEIVIHPRTKLSKRTHPMYMLHVEQIYGHVPQQDTARQLIVTVKYSRVIQDRSPKNVTALF